MALGEPDLHQAETLLGKANDLGEHARLPESAHQWYIVQAQIQAIRDLFDAAADLLDEARDICNPGPVPDCAPLDARQAQLDLFKGDSGSASRWAASSGVHATDELLLITEFSHLTLARLLIARNQQDTDPQAAQRALDLLLRLAKAAGAANRTGSLMEIHLLQGRCHELLGNDMGARQAWLVGMALPEAERQADLLVMEDVETRKALSSAYPHTKNIYPKLDVNYRRAAVRRAGELEIT